MTTDNLTNEPKQTKAKSSQDFVFTEAQVEAAAREWYEQANGYETWASASGKHQQVVKVRAAKALEAATRVPVQGEPNDDREALRKEFEYRIRTAVAYGSGLGYRELPVQERADWIQREIRNAVAIASRATVPDAATTALRREAAVLELRNRYGQSNGAQTWIEFQGDPHFIVNQVLAALDGAPEPEWEYGEIGPANQVHMTTPERVRKSEALGWSQEIVRRYTAGPWVSVKVGDIGE